MLRILWICIWILKITETGSSVWDSNINICCAEKYKVVKRAISKDEKSGSGDPLSYCQENF